MSRDKCQLTRDIQLGGMLVLAGSRVRGHVNVMTGWVRGGRATWVDDDPVKKKPRRKPKETEPDSVDDSRPKD